MIDALAWSSAAVFSLLFLLWLVSLALRDVSIVDIFWGPLFAVIAWTVWVRGGSGEVRAVLLVALTTAWALRLAGHLWWRKSGEPEDRRYAAMRDRHGSAFSRRSLFVVFWLQGALAFVVSLPLVYGILAGGAAPTLTIAAGSVLWLVGFLFETIGDLQLARFRNDPDHRGEVLDRGLWR